MTRYTRSPRKRLRHGQGDIPYEEIRVVNPSRGLNETVADILIDNKDASSLDNIDFAEGGVVQKRPGYKSIGSGLTAAPNGGGVWVQGTSQTLVVSDAGKVKTYNGTSWAQVGGSVTLDANAPVHFTSVNGELFCWDGVNGGSVVGSDNTIVRPGRMPRGKFSVVYKEFHFVSGVAGRDVRVYMSAARDPRRFTRKDAPTNAGVIDLSSPAEVPGATVFDGDNTPQAFDVDRYEGGKVTGFGFHQDLLIIFKENSIYQVEINDTGVPIVQRITDAYGCVSHGSIRTIDNDSYFLGRQGVFVLGNEPNYYASIRTNELSSRIKDTISQIRQEEYERIRSNYWNNRYLLSVPIRDKKNNLLVVYDKRFYAWGTWSNINASSINIYIDPQNREQLVFTGSDSPTLNQFTPGIFNDNGQAIKAHWTSRAFHGRKLDVEKYWKEIRPIFRQVTGTVSLDFFDENGTFGDTAPITDPIVGGLGAGQVGLQMFGLNMTEDYTLADLGLADIDDTDQNYLTASDSANNVYSIRIARDAQTFKFRVSNNNVDETFVLLGFIIFFRNKDSDRFDGQFAYR